MKFRRPLALKLLVRKLQSAVGRMSVAESRACQNDAQQRGDDGCEHRNEIDQRGPLDGVPVKIHETPRCQSKMEGQVSIAYLQSVGGPNADRGTPLVTPGRNWQQEGSKLARSCGMARRSGSPCRSRWTAKLPLRFYRGLGRLEADL